MLFVEHFLLTKLHIVFERHRLHQFKVVVNLQKAVCGFITSFVEVAFVFEEEKAYDKGYGLSFGLFLTVCFNLKEVIEKVHSLLNSSILVR